MVSAENRIGLYIAIPVYFLLLVAASYWAYRRSEQLKKSNKSDTLNVHYLGAKDFGPILSTGTLFASLFSGYTVVGIPNEAFNTGWMSFRWFTTYAGIIFGLIGAGFRLHKVGKLRNHSTPSDFITDRYQSQILRYVIVFLQIVPTVIYLAGQVVAIKSTFNNIFGLNPDAALPTIVIMALILIFECVGGLNSVALTDTIQAFVMVFSFIAIPLVMKIHYGGWDQLDPETYPKPEFYQTPIIDQQLSFWQFSLINISFFTMPHIMQRFYAAKSVKSLKIAFSVITAGPWICYLSGIFMGTIGVTILVAQDGTPLESNDPFSDILEALMGLGGFANVIAVIATTGSLAAIMSTADSLIIAISQLVTVEILEPLLTPSSDESSSPSSSSSSSLSTTTATSEGPKKETAHPRMVWYGRIASIVSVVFALLIGLFWSQGLSDLANIEFQLSAQALPAFFFGLFSRATVRWSEVHPWNVAAGAILGCVYVITLYFGYLKPNTASALPLDAGVTGFCLNVLIILVFDGVRRVVFRNRTRTRSFARDDDATGSAAPAAAVAAAATAAMIPVYSPDRPMWDVPTNKLSQFGSERLTPPLISECMAGLYEPMTNWSWVLLILGCLSYVTPMIPGSEPPLDPATGTFFSMYLPVTINGLPWWVTKLIISCLMCYTVLLITLYKIPNDDNDDDEYPSLPTPSKDLLSPEAPRIATTSHQDTNAKESHFIPTM